LDVTSTQRASTRGTRRASLGRWPALGPRVAGAGLLAASGSRLAAAAGALFAASTLGGYLLSDWVGLFGFKEVRTTAGIVAGVIEVAAFAALATYTLAASPRRGPARLAAGLAGRLSVARTATTAVGSASVLALVLPRPPRDRPDSTATLRLDSPAVQLRSTLRLRRAAQPPPG
jgi:hypothetical protein